VKRYLYYSARFGSGIYRAEVTRETDSNIWVKGEASEIKVSKNGYMSVHGYDATFFQEETPEILEKFIKDNLKRRFNNHLVKLKDCKDIDIIKQVLNIIIE